MFNTPGDVPLFQDRQIGSWKLARLYEKELRNSNKGANYYQMNAQR